MNDKVSTEKFEFSFSPDNFKDFSQETAHRIISAMVDGVTVVGLDGKILECNDAVLRLHGVSREEYIGKNVYDFIVPEDRQRAIEEASVVLEKGHLCSEVKALRKKGGPFDAEINVSMLRDASGEPVAFLGVTRDITEWNKKKEELVRLADAVKLSIDSIVISDIDAKIVDVNEATLKMYGTDNKGDFIGKNSFDLIAPEDREKALEGMKKALEKGYVKSREYHVITKDGRRIPVGMSVSIMKAADGKPIGFVGISRDITERKKAEEALLVSEEKFRTIFENVHDVITYVDTHGKILDVNNMVEDLFGYKRDEIIGKNFVKLGIIGPKDIPRMLKLFIGTIRKGEAEELVELELKHKNGKKVFVEVSTRFIRKNGKVEKALNIFRDITDRKKAENALRGSEEKFRSLTEATSDLVWEVDQYGVYTYASPKVLDLLGYEPEEIIGKTPFDLMPPDEAKRIAAEFGAIAETKKPFDRLENVNLHKDGHQVVLETSGVPILDASGNLEGYRGIDRDITERKQMEEKLGRYSEHLEELVQKRTEELSESEKRYSVVVEEASDGVAIAQDEKFVFVNKGLLEIVGYSRDELIGLPFENLVDEKYRQLVKQRYEQRMQGEKVPATYEIELIAKNGERVPVELSATRIHYQGRLADLVIVRDISERKRIEEQRSRLEKLATIGELATMVAHDLRNPLTSIRNASFYIKNSCPSHAKPECKAALEMFDIIEQETVFANNIINDLLDFAARRPLQKKKQNMNSLIDDSLKRIHIPENISVERKHAKKATAAADEKQLERVFLNLTKNAVQAMPNGGTLTIATNETKNHIEIAFADTGMGIQEENVNKLFTPLFTTKAKGIGMGLAICKKIVEQHGGTIEAKSKVGQGTTLTIKLPKKHEENAQ